MVLSCVKSTGLDRASNGHPASRQTKFRPDSPVPTSIEVAGDNATAHPIFDEARLSQPHRNMMTEILNRRFITKALGV